MGNYKLGTVTFQVKADKGRSTSMHSQELQKAIGEFITKATSADYEVQNVQVRKRRTKTPS